MKLLEHAPESGYNDEDTITYKQDREIIKIENVNRVNYEDGFMYAEITFEPIEGDEVCMKSTYNEPYCMICKFDTEFEGDYWEAEDEDSFDRDWCDFCMISVEPDGDGDCPHCFQHLPNSG